MAPQSLCIGAAVPVGAVRATIRSDLAPRPAASLPRGCCLAVSPSGRRPAWEDPNRRRLSIARGKKGEPDGLSDGSPESLYVPPDLFDGDTCETRAAATLNTMFTFVAVRVVMEQMSGDRHRSPMYNRIRDYVNNEEPIRNGTEWLATLMRHPDNEMRMLSLRILETRAAYMDTAFDFKELKDTTEISVKSDNAELMRTWMMDCMAAGSSEGECAADFDAPPDGQ